MKRVRRMLARPAEWLADRIVDVVLVGAMVCFAVGAWTLRPWLGWLVTGGVLVVLAIVMLGQSGTTGQPGLQPDDQD